MTTSPGSVATTDPGTRGTAPDGALGELVRQRVRTRFESAAPYERQLERAVNVAQSMFGVATVELDLFDQTLAWQRATGESSWRARTADDPSRGLDADDDGLTAVRDIWSEDRLADLPELADQRFFASVPLRESGGNRVGALRLLDPQPRVLTEPERYILREVATQVEREIAHRQELEQVGLVQRSLLPRPMTSLAGYDLAGAYRAARVVGGDFFDWFPTRDGGVGFTLADVMGKGIGAAIIAATIRGVMRSGARSGSIGPTLDAATAALDTDADGAPGFVTLVHGRLAPDTGTVRYVDAGHGLSLIVHAAERTSTRLAGIDLPLGIQGEGEWHEGSVVLRPGDAFVTVSDGVLDFFAGSLIALEEVENIVLEADTAQAAADEIVRRMGIDAGDDVTALVVRRLPD